MRKVVLQFWISLDGYSVDEGTGLWQVMEEIDDPASQGPALPPARPRRAMTLPFRR